MSQAICKRDRVVWGDAQEASNRETERYQQWPKKFKNLCFNARRISEKKESQMTACYHCFQNFTIWRFTKIMKRTCHILWVCVVHLYGYSTNTWIFSDYNHGNLNVSLGLRLRRPLRSESGCSETEGGTQQLFAHSSSMRCAFVGDVV